MKQAKVLTDKELKRVIEYVDAVDRYAERNRAMILLTHYLGLRVSELANLRTDNVLNEHGELNDVIYLNAEQTKGSKSRRVFVGKKAKAVLNRYFKHATNASKRTYIFSTQQSHKFNVNALTQLFKQWYARAGIVGASSHSGRRGMITKLAASGVSVRVIAEIVGHANIGTTQRYIDVNDEMMSNAVELV